MLVIRVRNMPPMFNEDYVVADCGSSTARMDKAAPNEKIVSIHINVVTRNVSSMGAEIFAE